MTTKLYKCNPSRITPEQIRWGKKQAKKYGISYSHLNRILMDMAQDIDIEEIIKKYK